METMSKKNDPLFPILLIDDEKGALDLMSMTLKVAGYSNIQTFNNSEHGLDYIVNHKTDLVVLDIVMPGISGLDLLLKIKEVDPDLPVIMASGVNEVETAVRCIKNGAYDYILKPIETECFEVSVRNALKARQMERDYQLLAERMLSSELKNSQVFDRFHTRNSKMFSIFKYIEALGPTSYPVLITGETGTGKEIVARSIHESSGLKGDFIAVNVAGLDDIMFSDTLFGHQKGAYTGADSVRAGLIERAANGTLFLDEIGDLSPQSQIKLLRLIQEREYYPLGADHPKKSFARIVTATCQDVASFMTNEKFRKDLYYRLKTHHIHLPPLRERKEDLPLLIDSFLAKAAIEQNKSKPKAPPELYTMLGTYHFPGNIRELEAVINDAVCLHESRMLSLKVFKEKLGISAVSSITENNEAHERKITFHEKLPSLREIEDLLIQEALDRSNGNLSLASELIGMARQSFSYRIRKLNLN